MRIIQIILVCIFCAKPLFAEPRVSKSSIEPVIQRLAALDPKSSSSLAEVQADLMLPARYAFAAEDLNLAGPILKALSSMIAGTVSLGELRSGSGKYSRSNVIPILLDPSRSGPNSRRIFPVQETQTDFFGQRKIMVTDSQLEELEFSFLISAVLRYVVFSKGPIDPQRREFVRDAVGFLTSSFVGPFWKDVEAWHWGGAFPNMKERAIARLEWYKIGRKDIPKYYMAFHDADLFYFGICANLRAVEKELAAFSVSISKFDSEVIQEVSIFTRKMFDQRLEAGNDFNFQVGLWSDHPEFRHAGCDALGAPPTHDCVSSEIVMDTSHFHRFPWLLESFYFGAAPGSSERIYYENLLVRLSKHLQSKVIDYAPEMLPRLTNFMNGKNGWFRVGYESRPWGYAPFTLSATARYGSWYLLGAYDPSFKKFTNAMCDMVISSKPEVVAHRTKYFGQQVAVPGNRTKWTSIDQLGPSSLAASYCRMAAKMGLSDSELAEAVEIK